ncbi:hypothetical protein ACFL5O_03270 [Myxococcota bacterium]
MAGLLGFTGRYEEGELHWAPAVRALAAVMGPEAEVNHEAVHHMLDIGHLCWFPAFRG